jgi:peptidoglycan biosynthesis protein MviN/MurJ (putative lipid II flippase)
LSWIDRKSINPDTSKLSSNNFNYPIFRYSTLISTIFSILDFASGVLATGVRQWWFQHFGVARGQLLCSATWPISGDLL